MTPILSSELAADLLRRGHSVRLRAGGGSMRPCLRPGAVVTVTPVTAAAPLRLGEIAFVRCGGRLMLHRVVRTHPRLRTKGDALGVLDPTPDAVLGRVAGSGGVFGRGVAHVSRTLRPVQRAVILLRLLRVSPRPRPVAERP